MTVAQSIGTGYGAAGAQSALRQTALGQQSPARTDYQVSNPNVGNIARASDSLLNVAESQQFNTLVTAGFGMQAIAAGVAGGYVGAKIGNKLGHGIARALNFNQVATEGESPAHLGHPIAHQKKIGGCGGHWRYFTGGSGGGIGGRHLWYGVGGDCRGGGRSRVNRRYRRRDRGGIRTIR
ncbi:hypothetical protein MY066_12935 [Yersinia pestis subsp. pestis]|nr:hypothetical protein [Yersinia pestis]MCV6851405.1 hypothetical protein [Yersinia pestis subsp. pestis]